MAVQQLFYKSAIPVSAERHGELAVRTGGGYGFARAVNAVPVTAVEFAQAGAEYPIIFAGTEGAVFPSAVLGTREGENLFVAADGSWRGKYVPAFVRRYPFVFSVDDAGTRFTLHVDEEFEGVNREGRGERLFDADGAQTQYLKGVLEFLRQYQARFTRTQAFCRRLVEHDLLQPMQAQFSLAAGERRVLGGFQVVDREKLKKLGDEAALDLFRSDEMECIYLHLASLRHFNDMLERMQPEPAPAEAGDEAGAGDEADEAPLVLDAAATEGVH